MNRTWLRWTPAIAVPALIAVGAVAAPFSANASADLPEKSASEVLQLAQSVDVSALSGSITQTSNLGLPDLSGLSTGVDDGGDSLASALELLTGTHDARVYLDADRGSRLQVLDSMAERDVISNGTDVWVYDSEQKTVLHATVPDSAEHPDEAAATPPDAVLTPAELADRFLTAVDPTTDVTVGNNVSVAGRGAYELVLSPKSDDTLIGSVSIAVDAETGFALQVAVTARGATQAAFLLGFTRVSFDTPDASLFDFTPPAGTEVTEQPAFTDPADPSVEAGAPESGAEPQLVSGAAWDAIVELPASADPAASSSSPLLEQLGTKTASGHLFETALLSVLITDDGRVLAGAVPAEALEAAAAR